MWSFIWVIIKMMLQICHECPPSAHLQKHEKWFLELAKCSETYYQSLSIKSEMFHTCSSCSISVLAILLSAIQNALRIFIVSSGVPCIEKIACSQSAKIIQFPAGLDTWRLHMLGIMPNILARFIFIILPGRKMYDMILQQKLIAYPYS